MKKSLLLTFSFVFLFLVANLSCTSSSKKSGFDLRPNKTVKLKNGLPVLLIQDKSLPALSLVMMVKSGSSSDPMGKSGLANMTANLLDKGAGGLSAIEIADQFGQLGTEFSADADKDYTFLEVTGLSFHTDKLLQGFSNVVMKPDFQEAELARERKRLSSQLRNVVDRPGSFASLVFDTYLYGAHPYSRASIGTIRDLQSIKVKAVKEYYQAHYRPNNAWLAVVGDFGDDIVQRLNASFGQWQSKKTIPPLFPKFPEIQGVQIQLVTKKDLKQSEVRMGHKGIQRTDPDFLPLRVANTILGGAFASRLMGEIRIKRGLTYGINSSFSALKDHGPFKITSATRHEKVGELVRESLNVLKDFRQGGVTDQELNDAKALLKGVFPRVLETAERTAQNMLILRYYGIPDSYLTNYLETVDKISKKDVNRAIKKHMDPENLKILVFSRQDKVIDQLRPIGTVRVRNFKEFL